MSLIHPGRSDSLWMCRTQRGRSAFTLHDFPHKEDHCVYSETSKGGEDRLSLWGHFQRAGGANRRCVTCFYTCTRFSNDRRSPVVEMETVVFIFGVVI